MNEKKGGRNRMEVTMFRVPIEYRNAARRYGTDYIEEVSVKVGRTYYTDQHGSRYAIGKKKTTPDGDSIIYESTDAYGYSGEWMLFESEDAAKRFIFRELLKLEIRKNMTQVDSLTLQQMQTIHQIFSAAVGISQTEQRP